MNDPSRIDEDLARILKRAGRRPVPSDEAVASAREAVRAEWQAVAARRRRKRLWAGGAIAASLLAAIALLSMPGPEPVMVASIDRLSGSIYVSTDAGELERASDLSILHAGQSLRTGRESVAGLRLAGGESLRVAPDTSLAFLSRGVVELKSGKVYIDSEPDPLAGFERRADAPVRIRTMLGEVTHVGTQYMVELDDGSLVVSVRRGEVVLDDAVRAAAGERLVTNGLGVRRNGLSRWGEDWRWAEQAGPAIDVERQTAEAFLRWVSHETGLDIDYVNAATADNAATTVLSGSIDAPPREALAAWVLAADYAYEIDQSEGVIRIERR